MKLVPENINEIIKHLPGRSDKEVLNFKENFIENLRAKSQDTDSIAEEFSWILQNIYGDRKQLIKDLMDEGLDPNEILVNIVDNMQNESKWERRWKLDVMRKMFHLIEKNKDKINFNELI